MIGWLRATKIAYRGAPPETLANRVFVLGIITVKEEDMAPKKDEKQSDVPAPVEQGEVSFYIGEKLPEVFGQYSSLEVGIGVKIPGDPMKFEAHVDKFLSRMVMKIQTTMNVIAQGSGYKAVWGGQQAALPTPPADPNAKT